MLLIPMIEILMRETEKWRISLVAGHTLLSLTVTCCWLQVNCAATTNFKVKSVSFGEIFPVDSPE